MKISIVMPVFNEEKTLGLLRERLEKTLKDSSFAYEIIFVNDGSQDRTSELIQEWIMDNPNVILLELSRNFGHQPAITAGLTEASGDAAIILDADLQDPPELIPQFIEKWQAGNRVVLAERTSRKESGIRSLFFGMFYKIFSFLSDGTDLRNAGVFCLMDRVVINHFLLLEERNRFIPGLRQWLGFSVATVKYDRQARHSGEPKQTFFKLLKYAFDAIFSFSYKPLRFSFILGLVISFACFIYAGVLIALRLSNVHVVSGFTTVAVAVLFLSGIILISNGILGEYLGRIYDEVKNRPLYIIARQVSRSSNKKELTIVEHASPRIKSSHAKNH